MQKMGGRRKALATARVAFALIAPMAAGCAPSPRAPVSECVSSHATVQESRLAIEGAIERIGELYGTLLERFRKVKELAESLHPEAYGRITMHLIFDLHFPVVDNSLAGMKDSLERLGRGLAAAGGDAGRMRILAQVACTAQEIAEVTVESCTGILNDAYAEVMNTGKPGIDNTHI